MTRDDVLLIEQDEGVLTLTNNDSPINRMSFEYMDQLEPAVDRAAADPSVRALVFTASGDVNFSVGMDLKQLLGVQGEAGGMDHALDLILRAKKIDAPCRPSRRGAR